MCACLASTGRGVGMKVRPRSRTSRSSGDSWTVERLVTLERETGGVGAAPCDPTVNPVGPASPSSSISPSPESSGCYHEWSEI